VGRGESEVLLHWARTGRPRSLFDLLEVDLVLTWHARVVGAHPCHMPLQRPLPRRLPHGRPAVHLLAKQTAPGSSSTSSPASSSSGGSQIHWPDRRWRNVGPSSSLDESESESSQTLLMAWQDAPCKIVCDETFGAHTFGPNVNCKTHLFLGCSSANTFRCKHVNVNWPPNVLRARLFTKRFAPRSTLVRVQLYRM
jgi:hypothetical protein